MTNYSSDVGFFDVHGEMYRADVATATTINTQNDWEQILNFSQGAVDNVSFASNALTVAVSGDFDIVWTASSAIGTTNKTFEMAVFIDGALQDKTQSRRRFSTADIGVWAGSGIINITSGQVVDLRCRNITDDTDITHNFCNLKIHRI
jgi:hypothetical protein